MYRNNFNAKNVNCITVNSVKKNFRGCVILADWVPEFFAFDLTNS